MLQFTVKALIISLRCGLYICIMKINPFIIIRGFCLCVIHTTLNSVMSLQLKSL